MTSEWIHQLIRPAGDSSSSRQPRRNVAISVAMNSPMTTDSMERVWPSATGRTIARRTRRNRMPASTATANGVSATR